MSTIPAKPQPSEQQSSRKYESLMKIETIEEIKEQDKTQLQQSYTIWVMMKQNKYQAESYESVLKPVASFQTVEDFWALYQHFRRPTQMTFGTSLNIFVDPVKPMWEDENCVDGGCWSIRVPKTHTNKYWEDLLMAMIGEQFSIEGEILGMAIALRPNQDNIKIWIRHGSNKETVETIKADIEKFIKIDEGVKIDYENFKEVIAQNEARQQERAEKGGDEDQDNQRFERGTRGGRGGRGRGRGGYQQQ